MGADPLVDDVVPMGNPAVAVSAPVIYQHEAREALRAGIRARAGNTMEVRKTRLVPGKEIVEPMVILYQAR